MITVSVRADVSRLRRNLGASLNEANRAAVAALNRTAQRARTYGARAIRDAGYGIKVNAVRRAIKVERAGAGHLSASTVASGRPIPLIAYSARQTSTGVTVNVLKGRKTIRHAFIATMRSGHRGVFIQRRYRVGGNRNLKRAAYGSGARAKHGLPIDELFGPSIPSAFINERVQRVLQQQATTYFPIEMERQLHYLMSRS